METLYKRNYLYVSDEDQIQLKNFPVLIAGAGLGSNIAENLIRIGFENLTIVDGDIVEITNLNRQNYTYEDVGVHKVDVLYKRLKTINPNINLKPIAQFITPDNLTEIIKECKVVINAIDFENNMSIHLDDFCMEHDIIILHPYNLGLAGAVCVIDKTSLNFRDIQKNKKSFSELDVVKYFLSYLRFWDEPQEFLEDILNNYLSDDNKEPSPPQLGIASSLVAAMCTSLIYKICTRKPVKKFPEFYFINTDT
ncbi:ThiF family protein [Tenacibaculum sp. 190524A02b]|uniref:ThiF family adenylyltransferase n=1 Tax=Tenacibaculum vairaonense TaxID=3137860 RepID=UPI0032B222FE